MNFNNNVVIHEKDAVVTHAIGYAEQVVPTRIERAKAKATNAWNSVKGFFKTIEKKLANAIETTKDLAQRAIKFVKGHKKEMLIVTGIFLMVAGMASAPFAPFIGVCLAIAGSALTTHSVVKLNQKSTESSNNNYFESSYEDL